MPKSRSLSSQAHPALLTLCPCCCLTVQPAMRTVIRALQPWLEAATAVKQDIIFRARCASLLVIGDTDRQWMAAVRVQALVPIC